MSTTAKIGIGVGAGAAVAVVAALALVCCLRNRSPMKQRGVQISKPLPGAGRTYADDYQATPTYEKNMNELEMRSRRYEDMVPRHSPRAIV